MKTIKNLFILCLIAAYGCSESVTDEFDQVNGNVEQKLIKSIVITSALDDFQNEMLLFSYNNNQKLTSVTNGEETSFLIYSDNELNTVTGGGEQVSIEELYQSPFDAFEEGYVLEYDKNGNPFKIEFNEYIYENYEEVAVAYTAEVLYDDTPNPFFYTMESAGIIDILDKVELNFALPQQPSEIIKARALFPLNNPSKITYKNEKGEIVYIISAEYSYDAENYPVSASVTATSLIDNETDIYIATYTYL